MAIEISGPSDGDSGEARRRQFRRKESTPVAFGPGEKPHDLDTERGVLSGIFLSSDALAEVQEVLKPDDFFHPAHKEIFKTMQRLSMAGIPVDITTVAGNLREQGLLDSIGGAAYLSQVCATPSSSAHAFDYATIVSDLAWRRRLLEASERCRSAALQAGDTREIASMIEKTIFDTTQSKKTSTLVAMKDLVIPSIKEFERRVEQKDAPDQYVLTGLKDLDGTLNGLRPGQLIVIAAGPGTGKTSLAANIMVNATVKQKKNVLFFSLEMTSEEVVERVMSFMANIDLGKLRAGRLSPNDFSDLYYAADEVATAPLYIDDRSVLSPFDALAQARKLAAMINMKNDQEKLDLIVVDYIQIMKGGVNTENRSLEVAAITGGLKAIAKEFRVPVIALSQLNRDRSKRTGADSKKPQLSDLRDSGAIEADADVVMFIHREPSSPEQDSRAPSEAEIIIAKHRAGPTRTVKVTWLGHLTKFVDFMNPQNVPEDIPTQFNDPSGSTSLTPFDPSTF